MRFLNAFQRWDATGLTLQRGNKQTTWQRQAFTGPGRYTLREDCSDGSRRESVLTIGLSIVKTLLTPGLDLPAGALSTGPPERSDRHR